MLKGFGMEKEFDFLARADLNRYAGRWIALLDEKVIVVGDSFKEVAEKVDKEFPNKKPLLSRIPEKIAQIL